jgi:hypothetical protein
MSAERTFWQTVNRALKMISAAIDKYVETL